MTGKGVGRGNVQQVRSVYDRGGQGMGGWGLWFIDGAEKINTRWNETLNYETNLKIQNVIIMHRD